MTEPDREEGAVQMSFGDAALSAGVLLLPPTKKGGFLAVGSAPVTPVSGCCLARFRGRFKDLGFSR